MGEANATSSRRGLIGRALVLAAGALGVQAGGAGAAVSPTLSLYGRGLHLHSPSHRPGQVPDKGERFTTYGELAASPTGQVIGHVTGAFLALDSPFASAAGSHEVHAFHLEDGTIFGVGSAGSSGSAEFAITGGTGRFRGARGWYVARQQPRELGGDGTAEYHLTLVG